MGLRQENNVTHPIEANYYEEKIEGHSSLALFLHCFGIMIRINIINSVECAMIAFVHRACGMFTVITHRLEYLTKSKEIERKTISETDEGTYRNVVYCIRKHNEVLRFIEFLDYMYDVSFYLRLRLIILLLVPSILEAVINVRNLRASININAYTLYHVTHILIEVHHVQELIKYSRRLERAVYASKWYETSPRTRRILCVMLIKCQTPCSFAVRKVVVNYQILSAFVRMTYLTMFRALQ
ncbi:hypothetical protein KM043_010134 [Ampulex compressa]|nr:hypothetical protein KM043_010134 [Ampulex compressa]